MLTAMCTRESLTTEPLVDWVRLLRPAWWLEDPDQPVPLHRKLWEWAFIAQSLEEHGMLAPGRRGLGFGVGREPLVALFAGRGCEIVATDLVPARARRTEWRDEHAARLEDVVTWDDLCPPGELRERVTFRSVDMRAIPTDLRDFDFVWSSCALEHLGSIAQGQAFVMASLGCVREGGVAVHTTEFNRTSDRRTATLGSTVLLRRRDVSALARRLDEPEHRVPQEAALDREPVAEGPYDYPHLQVRIGEFVTTSLGLAIERHGPARVPTALRRATVAIWGVAGSLVRAVEGLRRRRRSRAPQDGCRSGRRADDVRPAHPSDDQAETDPRAAT